MNANSVLIDALDSYSLNLGDYKGDTAAIANAISKCKDYLSHNTVTTDWVKSNWGNRLNIVSDYRKFLVGEIHDARNTENNEVLAELRAEYDILAPYIDLFKKFPDFIQ